MEYFELVVYELILLIEVAVDVDLYDFQSAMAEEGVCFEYRLPSPVQPSPVLITDEVA